MLAPALRHHADPLGLRRPTELPPRELGLALLQERAHALLVVLAVEAALNGLCDLGSVGLIRAGELADGGLDGAQGQRSVLRDALRQCEGVIFQLDLGDYLAYQAHREGFARVDAARRVEQ